MKLSSLPMSEYNKGTMETPCTARKLLFDVADILEDLLCDSRSASQEARAILEHVLKTEVVQIMADLVGIPSDEQISKVWELVRERQTRKPLAYILGNGWFYNHSFYVTNGVLVPRPETEILVDEAIRFLKGIQRNSVKVLDLYTGCGNVILSVASECEWISGTGVDIDKNAISCAERNQAVIGPNSMDLICQDIMEFINPALEKFHLVTANPPYIPTKEIPSLQPEISSHENHSALDGGIDGLDHYRFLSSAVKTILENGGIFISEIGIGQKEPVSDLFSGWADVQFTDDLSGIPRVLRAKP